MPYSKADALENLQSEFEAYANTHGIDVDSAEDLASFGDGNHQGFLQTYFATQDAIERWDPIALRLALPARLVELLKEMDGEEGLLTWLSDTVVGEEAVRIGQLASYVASQWLDSVDQVLKAAAHQVCVVANG